MTAEHVLLGNLYTNIMGKNGNYCKYLTSADNVWIYLRNVLVPSSPLSKLNNIYKFNGINLIYFFSVY